jgi:uncharacterized protein
MMYLALFFIAFLAFSISAVCGGGAGLLLIPILGYYLPVAQVPVALTLGTASSSFSRIWLFFDAIRWDISKVFLPAALPGVILGAQLLSNLPPMYLELCMGLFLVGNLPLLFRQQTPVEQTVSPVPLWQLISVGVLAGFISGLTGAVGVLFNRFYFRYGLNTQQLIATRAANEALLHLIKLYLYATLGLFQPNALLIGLIVALAALLSSRAIQTCLPHISKAFFMRGGYAAMVISGIMLLNSAIIHIRLAHQPELRLNILADELEAGFSWNSLAYALEFNYGEGLEFEQVIPLSALSAEQRHFVESRQAGAAQIVVEQVDSLSSRSYEAHYYDDQHRLSHKIEFE